ncbi:hypothetical protein DYY66_0173 [Candidatus Nitrosotalea sp. FS]|uniref:hypothetical protein n=1 Tax=Candidatus Nitrosotalea sp. FS TaxID=2341021 RepID=UPI001408922F|nr:hypothetical protein [Candidatus Nitrosotalea sp. FS]NHH98834.1 hypothetical protein [Candidatus Nitrosotalea sp. FS]
MHSKKTDVFGTMTSKIESEFPQCSRIHADWEFVLTDKKTGEVKNNKKFRILAILNDAEKYQHVGVIIPDLSNEYVQLPDLVEKFLSDLKKTADANMVDVMGDKKSLDMSGFKFTGNVYLYTDKLLVSEDVIQKHFAKSNMHLQSRVEKKNLSL